MNEERVINYTSKKNKFRSYICTRSDPIKMSMKKIPHELFLFLSQLFWREDATEFREKQCYILDLAFKAAILDFQVNSQDTLFVHFWSVCNYRFIWVFTLENLLRLISGLAVWSKISILMISFLYFLTTWGPYHRNSCRMIQRGLRIGVIQSGVGEVPHHLPHLVTT